MKTDPVTRKLGLNQAAEMSERLKTFLHDALEKNGSFMEYATGLSDDDLVAYLGAIRILGLFAPPLFAVMQSRDPAAIEAAMQKRVDFQLAQRRELVRSGGHDAL